MQQSLTNRQPTARQTLEIQRINSNAFDVIRYHNIPGLIARIILLCISPMYFGYSLTYFSAINIIPTIMPNVFGPNLNNAGLHGWLLGCITLGAAVGALISPFIMRCFKSRRAYVLIFNVLAIVIGGVIQIPNIYAFFVCRVIQGFCFGNYMAIIPIYINQLAPKQLMGTLGVMTQLGAITGVTFCYLLGLIFTLTGVEAQVYWRLLFVLFDLFILIQTAFFLTGFIPQSPNSLIYDGRQQEAKLVIGMFIKKEYVQQIFREKKIQVQLQVGKKVDKLNESVYSEGEKKIPLKYSWKAYLVGFNLPLMQQFTGINAIVTQAGQIVNDPNLQIYIPFIINAVQFLATITCLGILPLMGRRQNTLYGNLGLAIVDIILGIFFIFQGWKPATYIIVIFLIIYMIIYGTSLGPVVWMYVPQILPANIVPFATVLNWIGCSICIILLPIVTKANNGNSFPAFFFFGGWTFFAFLINYFYMIETKGLSTEEIVVKFHQQ